MVRVGLGKKHHCNNLMLEALIKLRNSFLLRTNKETYKICKDQLLNSFQRFR
jgi:hypothetical protein